MSERPTVRPVTLARLVELTNACGDRSRPTKELESDLNVTHRRARETILEAVRMGLLSATETTEGEEPRYSTTQIGIQFLNAVRDEDWSQVSVLLQNSSPHYEAFLDVVDGLQPTDTDRLLERLENDHVDTPYDFNQTSIDVLGDWGERLGTIQRNAFTGSYYRPKDDCVDEEFPAVLISVFRDHEETTGIDLRQRYLSIPELREYTCERLRCTRTDFDNALLSLAGQNVGKLELSGAPVDTGAKEAQLGIKQISRDDAGGLVSTDQSTDRIMSGVEQYGKQYYYLAIHEPDLTFTQESNQ